MLFSLDQTSKSTSRLNIIFKLLLRHMLLVKAFLLTRLPWIFGTVIFSMAFILHLPLLEKQIEIKESRLHEMNIRTESVCLVLVWVLHSECVDIESLKAVKILGYHWNLDNHNCIKCARKRVFPDRYSPVDSVFIRKNTSQRKPLFSSILCSALETSTAIYFTQSTTFNKWL